ADMGPCFFNTSGMFKREISEMARAIHPSHDHLHHGRFRRHRPCRRTCVFHILPPKGPPLYAALLNGRKTGDRPPAYQTSESGPAEIVVQGFPTASNKWQVSNAGRCTAALGSRSVRNCTSSEWTTT